MIVSDSVLIVSSGVQHFVYTSMNSNHLCSINVLCLFALHSWSKCFEISNRCLLRLVVPKVLAAACVQGSESYCQHIT